MRYKIVKILTLLLFLLMLDGCGESGESGDSVWDKMKWGDDEWSFNGESFKNKNSLG